MLRKRHLGTNRQGRRFRRVDRVIMHGKTESNVVDYMITAPEECEKAKQPGVADSARSSLVRRIHVELSTERFWGSN
jgi:hypothetical protein